MALTKATHSMIKGALSAVAAGSGLSIAHSTLVYKTFGAISA